MLETGPSSLTVYDAIVTALHSTFLDAITIFFVDYRAILFSAGCTIESVSEAEKKIARAKKPKANALYKDGLFAYARHINFGGALLWRSGMAILSGNMASLCSPIIRVVPHLDLIFARKYGIEWEDYKKRLSNSIEKCFLPKDLYEEPRSSVPPNSIHVAIAASLHHDGTTRYPHMRCWEVKKTATAKDIKEQYYKSAYVILGDPDNKTQYDLSLSKPSGSTMEATYAHPASAGFAYAGVREEANAAEFKILLPWFYGLGAALSIIYVMTSYLRKRREQEKVQAWIDWADARSKEGLGEHIGVETLDLVRQKR
ncbi:hypothetical protein BC829DRAFT_446776 [Chytridium lagenaria]|nr:hypothetical protein BC829DRAFT_446776 [Chytridium lagenaria]